MRVNNFATVLLGMILLAAVLYGGMKIVHSYASSANRDQLVSAVYDLGASAQKYFVKPIAIGGGGKSFIGWKVPSSFDKTEYGTFTAAPREKRLDLCAIGTQTGKNGFTNVRVAARIDSAGIKVTIVN